MWSPGIPAFPEEERGPEGTLRQPCEISGPLKGNAKAPKVTWGTVGVRWLAKFELGLSAASLNPSGASNVDLKQRTEPYNEKAVG
jgi:hypothetical protein